MFNTICNANIKSGLEKLVKYKHYQIENVLEALNIFIIQIEIKLYNKSSNLNDYLKIFEDKSRIYLN